MQTDEMTFSKWLLRHTKDESLLGELARSVAVEPFDREPGNADDLRAMVADAALARKAWRMYRRHIKDHRLE